MKKKQIEILNYKEKYPLSLQHPSATRVLKNAATHR